METVNPVTVVVPEPFDKVGVGSKGLAFFLRHNPPRCW